MEIPTPLGNRTTIALGAPHGRVVKEQLDAARAPVIVVERETNRGPREQALAVAAAMENHGWRGPWGLGAVCREIEDAADFTSAGCTWLTLDVARHLDASAAAMSLDVLDTAIVALEDAGVFPLEWHARFLDVEFALNNGATFRFSDEELARAAVKFGPALALAEQMHDAVRTFWMGRGNLPDIEFSIAAAPDATTPGELLFLAHELNRRGIGIPGCLRITPSFGEWHEPGIENDEPPSLAALANACPPFASLAIPSDIAARWPGFHHDARDIATLAILRDVATRDPALFREWLAVARDAFPAARAGRNLATTDDDTRALPEVADSELAATFLDHRQGRQLLLVTWDFVRAQLGARLA